MRIKKISVQAIIEYLGTDVITVYGLVDRIITNISDSQHVNENTLDWINPVKECKQYIAENSPARVLLTDPSIAYSDVIKDQGKTLIVVNNPKLQLAKIGNKFFVDKIEAGIHSTCCVDPDALVFPGVTIGAFSNIGKATIGECTVIGTNVKVYDNVIIGKHCRIKDGAVIGGEGFGFEKDEDGNRFRFPQIGDVKIGDYVEIGANTCIDRGALSSTSIGNYTKINNLCHIAHNNTIGENVVIAALVNISGGNVIEDDCWIAPGSSVRGYLRIGKGATIGMGAVVVKDIPSGEVWVGNPAIKLR